MAAPPLHVYVLDTPPVHDASFCASPLDVLTSTLRSILLLDRTCHGFALLPSRTTCPPLSMVRSSRASRLRHLSDFCFRDVWIDFSHSLTRGYRTYISYLLCCFTASICFIFLPASGPGYAFTSFPFTLPTYTHPHVINLLAPPNCFPSIHMAMAIIFCLSVWRWRVGKIIGGLHIILTICATLGLGEHYLVDLIAAVPFTLLILNAVTMLQAHFRAHDDLQGCVGAAI